LNNFYVKTSGKGEPLLVLHGWAMNSSVWDLVRADLESNYEVSWIDLPGHGKNHAIDARSLDEIIDYILPFIPQNCHLLGWSLGGLIVQALAQRVPQRIKSMTLVASTPRFSQKLSEDAQHWQHALSQDVLDNFYESMKADLEGTLKRFIALQFLGIKNSKTIQLEMSEKVLNSSLMLNGSTLITELSVSKDKTVSSLKTGGGASSAEHSRSIKINSVQIAAFKLGLKLLSELDFRYSNDQLYKLIPRHYLLSEYDRLVPVEVINDLKKFYPDAQITFFEKAGHAPFMTQPEKFIRVVTEFINHVR